MTRRRRGLSLGALVGGVLTLAGCFTVPSVPNRDPLWMRVDGQELKFKWCGDTTDAFSRLLVSVAVYGDERVDTDVEEGLGDFALEHGETFSTRVPPQGVVYNYSTPVDLGGGRVAIFVFTGKGPDNLNGLYVTFDVDSIQEVDGSGDWISPTGARSAETCPSE